MNFAHDSTSRLSATDELMMGSPHVSPMKPKKPQSGTDSAKTRSGSIHLEDVAVENLKKIDMPKPFSL